MTNEFAARIKVGENCNITFAFFEDFNHVSSRQCTHRSDIPKEASISLWQSIGDIKHNAAWFAEIRIVIDVFANNRGGDAFERKI